MRVACIHPKVEPAQAGAGHWGCCAYTWHPILPDLLDALCLLLEHPIPSHLILATPQRRPRTLAPTCQQLLLLLTRRPLEAQGHPNLVQLHQLHLRQAGEGLWVGGGGR